MNKTIMIILIALSVVLTACTQTNTFGPGANSKENNSQIANPASTFCIENGGRIEIRTANDGSQTGQCIFSNGIECEEWKFMRGECSPTNKKHVCTQEEKANKACTKEYMPVCGQNGKTYGNDCDACAQGIESYTNGECITNYTVSEILNESCSKDEDCETPMNYLIRSSCPYTTKCLDNKCAVICPTFNDKKDNNLNACTMELKICNDGTGVGRTGPNCEFEACPNEGTNKEKHICTITEKQTNICTLDYNPVCGNDNNTYGNGCGACSAKVDYWTRGECNQE